MGDILIGSQPIYSRRFGTKEVLKVLVGQEQIWPPEKKVTLIGIYAGSGTSQPLYPHQAGDVLVVMAVNQYNVIPTLPSGWNKAYSSTDLNNMGTIVGYLVATGANTVSPGWSNASYICTYVFRGGDSLFPMGSIDSLFTNGTPGKAPAITPQASNGSSIVVSNFVNNQSGAMATDSPIGWSSLSRTTKFIVSERIDSRLVLPSEDTLSTNASASWRGLTYEVKPPEGLQHIGTLSSNGTTGSFAPHQVGDLLVVIAQVQNAAVAFSPNTPPAVVGQTYPVYTNAYDSNISSVQGDRMACKIAWGIATTSSHTTGTFSGATWTTTMVFRNADQDNPFGDVAGSMIPSNTDLSIPTPALNLQDKSGKSLTMAWICESTTNASNNFSTNPPDGWVRLLRGGKRLINTAVDRKSGAPCIESVSSITLYWRTVAFEVKAVPLVTDVPPYHS